jgi:hypothetical protein
MKKLVLAVAVIATMIGCSKETEIAMSEVNNSVEFSSSGSFDLGSIDAAGNGVITYDLVELAEMCACAISEDAAAGLMIDHISGVGYYLSGVASSTGSNTTFSIELTVDGSTLSWADNAVIFTCETTSTLPCDLDVLSEQTFDCSNTSGTCGQNIVGGENGASYADCNWPWDIPGKSKK